jgi:hypothetical protein
MLKEILQSILNGHLKSKQALAHELGIQPETLEDMLHLLAKRGMLRIVECDEHLQAACAHCPMAEGGCNSNIAGEAYYVTDRGRRYAAK